MGWRGVGCFELCVVCYVVACLHLCCVSGTFFFCLYFASFSSCVPFLASVFFFPCVAAVALVFVCVLPVASVVQGSGSCFLFLLFVLLLVCVFLHLFAECFFASLCVSVFLCCLFLVSLFGMYSIFSFFVASCCVSFALCVALLLHCYCFFCGYVAVMLFVYLILLPFCFYAFRLPLSFFSVASLLLSFAFTLYFVCLLLLCCFSVAFLLRLLCFYVLLCSFHVASLRLFFCFYFVVVLLLLYVLLLLLVSFV